eukprot:326969_1
MAQPGDEKEDEGKQIDIDATKFGKYRCVFRAINDSLFIMMKDTKTKRAFSNTFSKSTLLEMNLNQSMDKIMNLLNEARAGSKSELTFKIGFGSAENNKKVSFNQLSKSYVQGHALCIYVAIDNSYFAAEYIFKLLEQKRNEIDILRDVIEDMQQEIDELKKNKPGIGSWYMLTALNKVQLEGAYFQPTIKDMANLSNDKKYIVVGNAGLYKVSTHLSWSTNGCDTSRYFEIKVNDNMVARTYGSKSGYGTLEHVINLKKGDKISFYTDWISGTFIKGQNSFTVQKL